MFILLNVFAIYSIKLLKEFNGINQNVNSYEYLKSFDDCLKKHIKINGKLARIVYPIIFFVSISIGFGYGFDQGIQKFLGGNSWESFQSIFSSTESALIFGGQIFALVTVVFLSSYYGEKLYLLDLKTTYGKILKKIDQTLADMEELRQEN